MDFGAARPQKGELCHQRLTGSSEPAASGSVLRWRAEADNPMGSAESRTDGPPAVGISAITWCSEASECLRKRRKPHYGRSLACKLELKRGLFSYSARDSRQEAEGEEPLEEVL
ncbi:MAG: hypothetical protein EBZ77_16545 [Chitinophagia bacterium]|nr:hypothetical protein [Chitinophagia bacterium]